jgi:hypothetical protein
MGTQPALKPSHLQRAARARLGSCGGAERALGRMLADAGGCGRVGAAAPRTLQEQAGCGCTWQLLDIGQPASGPRGSSSQHLGRQPRSRADSQASGRPPAASQLLREVVLDDGVLHGDAELVGGEDLVLVAAALDLWAAGRVGGWWEAGCGVAKARSRLHRAHAAAAAAAGPRLRGHAAAPASCRAPTSMLRRQPPYELTGKRPLSIMRCTMSVRPLSAPQLLFTNAMPSFFCS